MQSIWKGIWFINTVVGLDISNFTSLNTCLIYRCLMSYNIVFAHQLILSHLFDRSQVASSTGNQRGPQRGLLSGPILCHRTSCILRQVLLSSSQLLNTVQPDFSAWCYFLQHFAISYRMQEIKLQKIVLYCFCSHQVKNCKNKK